MGEGWHNNHHAYPVSVRQGFRWWEYDPTYYVLRCLSWLGVVWDLHMPPKAVLSGEHRLGQTVIEKVSHQLAASFPVERIADQVLRALASTPGWTDIRSRLLSARLQAETFWREVDLPHVPSLVEVRRYTVSRLAQTLSLEDISVSTRRCLLELVHSRLVEVAGTYQRHP
jgi:stearoyl-CoA desaturase (delta-9 desaturase)